jgi:hypothetical protein
MTATTFTLNRTPRIRTLVMFSPCVRIGRGRLL